MNSRKLLGLESNVDNGWNLYDQDLGTSIQVY